MSHRTLKGPRDGFPEVTVFNVGCDLGGIIMENNVRQPAASPWPSSRALLSEVSCAEISNGKCLQLLLADL